jgi:hypothetical protein
MPVPKKPKGRSSRAGGQRGKEDALFDLLSSLDAQTLARVRETLRAQLETFDGEPNPIELFDEFLRRVETLSAQNSQENEEFFGEVVATLTQLAIGEDAGDPQARELRKLVYKRLEERIFDGRPGAASLMLVGKVLRDSGWLVPDLLKVSLVDSLEAAGLSGSESAAADLGGALAEIVSASDGDAFAAYEAVNSVLAAFPSEAAARMVTTLGDDRAPLLLHVLAGFAMHRDPRLASAAIDALRRAAKVGPHESALVERVVRMRPWLPADRQAPLDEAIRALRENAEPPVPPDRPAAATCYVTACDRSGAAGALATLKAPDGWRFVAAMTNPRGVEEVLSKHSLSKRQVDLALRGMRENVMAAQTDVAGVGRYLELAIGENVAAREPPPFNLIAFVENLGLGPVAPRLISSADLLTELLAQWPENETDAAALARAYKWVVGGALTQPWFETGPGVERCIARVRGSKARAKAVLTAYLPARREFWARACARAAFALQLEPAAYGALARSLALVGREIVGDAPLETIPLMWQIAETTVGAFDNRPG